MILSPCINAPGRGYSLAGRFAFGETMPTSPGTFRPAHAEQATRAARKEADARRPSARERGYDSRWEKARLGYLRNHPLCVECGKTDRTEPATVVDHIRPHRGDRGLFWDSRNWQSLCKRHHDEKTAREDGGFGRRPVVWSGANRSRSEK